MKILKSGLARLGLTCRNTKAFDRGFSEKKLFTTAEEGEEDQLIHPQGHMDYTF